MKRLLDYLMAGASLEETKRLGAQQLKTVGNAQTIRFFCVKDQSTENEYQVIKLYPGSK